MVDVGQDRPVNSLYSLTFGEWLIIECELCINQMTSALAGLFLVPMREKSELYDLLHMKRQLQVCNTLHLLVSEVHIAFCPFLCFF